MTAHKDRRGGDTSRVADDKSRVFGTLPVAHHTTGRLWTRDEIIARYQIARCQYECATMR